MNGIRHGRLKQLSVVAVVALPRAGIVSATVATLPSAAAGRLVLIIGTYGSLPRISSRRVFESGITPNSERVANRPRPYTPWGPPVP
jgi:hypothetical protein